METKKQLVPKLSLKFLTRLEDSVLRECGGVVCIHVVVDLVMSVAVSFVV